MDKELQEIEDYASLLMTIDEIAIMLDFDIEEFRREVRGGKSLRAKAYVRGRMNAEIEIRRTVKAFAGKGSPQAEDRMIAWLKTQKMSE